MKIQNSKLDSDFIEKSWRLGVFFDRTVFTAGNKVQTFLALKS
jgi:hypothetical protein